MAETTLAEGTLTPSRHFSDSPEAGVKQNKEERKGMWSLISFDGNETRRRRRLYLLSDLTFSLRIL